MEENVRYSAFSRFITFILSALCVILSYVWIKDESPAKAVVLLSAFAVIVFLAMYYAPRSVKITDRHVIVRRLLRDRRIAIADISSVVLCPPTMAAVRKCGSGGWFGYWGWFKERDIGKYFAYYGRSSDCFLVRLKDGRQYVIGCDNAADVVDFILRHITDQPA